ncbi:putative PEX20 peroxisomal biogenesis factor 20 [Cladorrhinum sp. PSN332]|nr:putative PEX20 peroxisomal biogenesis factor 20 [Cladorrhinum sp. PSN332]
MADSMCGPSNGAKNLLAHTDRDRSHHQDRLVQAPQPGPSSFRSVHHSQPNANSAFEAFQGGGHPALHAPIEPLHMSVTQPMGPRVAAPYHGFHGPVTGPAIAAARLDSPATGNMGIHQGQNQNQNWVSEFSSMHINNTPTHSVPVVASHAPAMQGMHQPTLTMGYRPMAPPMSQAWIDSAPTIAAPIAQHSAVVPAETAETKSAFDDLFGQYDAANQQEHAHQTADFEAEQAKWMDEHGPSADAARAANQAAIQEMEAIAEQQDAQKRKMDDDLARAAGDILYAVEGNASTKFQQSNFLNLMRRIANREVVVEEKSFVNAVTGDEITIVMDEGPKDTVWHGEAVDAIEQEEFIRDSTTRKYE